MEKASSGGFTPPSNIENNAVWRGKPAANGCREDFSADCSWNMVKSRINPLFADPTFVPLSADMVTDRIRSARIESREMSVLKQARPTSSRMR